jgi:hypothetical protein
MNVTLHRNGYLFRADFLDVAPPCAPRVDLYRDGAWIGFCNWDGAHLTWLGDVALLDDPSAHADVASALDAAIAKALRA